jgi:type VI protein secretion system component Hcp
MSAYLYVPGIPGEDEGWIALLSYSLVASGSEYKKEPGTLTVMKKVDRASNGLMTAALSGKSFGAIVLYSSSGSRAVETTFTFAMVSAFQTSNDIETVSFAYETMTFKYSKVEE